MTKIKIPREEMYEEDVRRRPTYDHGAPRDTWEALDEIARASWEKNPTPREPEPWAR